MVWSDGALLKKLMKIQNVQVLTVEKDELNLLDQEKVKRFLSEHKPEEIYLAAAKVGGIQANNDYPTEFLYEKFDDTEQCNFSLLLKVKSKNYYF